MSTSADRMRRLRERRAAALAPVDGPSSLPEDEQLAPAVEETIAALKLGERDAAAVQLARQYARAVDQAQDPAAALRHFGPLLAKALDALQATPATRPAARPDRGGPPSKVAQLRAAHSATKTRRRRRA